MTPMPRFQAEGLIRQNIAEIDAYAGVFRERIVTAFATLPEDAEKAMVREMERLSAIVMFDDPGDAAQQAVDVASEYYAAVDSVRQGILNLMVAGLYHLLEQQAAYSLETALPKSARPAKQDYPIERLTVAMREQGIDLKRLPSWSLIEELGLIANSVKHGDGRSAKRLRVIQPDLFRVFQNPFSSLHIRRDLPIRPLVGEGLTLTAEHFECYVRVTKGFWEELIAALLPIMRPDLDHRIKRPPVS